MSRILTVAAAQLGPVQRDDRRQQVVARMIALLHQAAEHGVELVVYPELALTTFFPRWFVDDISEADHWYERSMPNAATQPLFDEARRLGIGFCLGYALLDDAGRRWNVQTLVERDGSIVATYTNGQQATVGQLAMASITNPGLHHQPPPPSPTQLLRKAHPGIHTFGIRGSKLVGA